MEAALSITIIHDKKDFLDNGTKKKMVSSLLDKTKQFEAIWEPWQKDILSSSLLYPSIFPFPSLVSSL